jgi:hypothetical protein
MKKSFSVGFICLCGAVLLLSTACTTFDMTEEDLTRERQKYEKSMGGQSTRDYSNPSVFGRPKD